MLLEIRQASDPEIPHRLSREPVLASFHPLILAVCRETRRFPDFPDGDPIELGLGIRDAALAAAEAALASAQRPARGPGAALAEAGRRLRELAFCIEIARRLGYLTTASAGELLALQARAQDALSRLAQRR